MPDQTRVLSYHTTYLSEISRGLMDSKKSTPPVITLHTRQFASSVSKSYILVPKGVCHRTFCDLHSRIIAIKISTMRTWWYARKGTSPGHLLAQDFLQPEECRCSCREKRNRRSDMQRRTLKAKHKSDPPFQHHILFDYRQTERMMECTAKEFVKRRLELLKRTAHGI